MHNIRLLGILVITLLCWSFPAFGSAGDIKEQPKVNFPLIYFSERMASDVGPRPEFILQLPLIGDHSTKADTGAIVPAIEIDTLGFMKRGHLWASTNGLGKIYYMQGDVMTSAHVVVPYVTVYRLMVINYDNAAGKEDNVSTRDWLVPGLQYAGVLEPPLTFHIDAELYQYSHLDNYRIRTGFSYDIVPVFTISAVYERQSWDIRAVQNDAEVGMKGHSDTVHLKGIYRFTKGGKQSGLNVAVSGGYENLSNSARTSLLEAGNVDRGSYIMEVAVSAGLLSW